MPGHDKIGHLLRQLDSTQSNLCHLFTQQLFTPFMRGTDSIASSTALVASGTVNLPQYTQTASTL